MKPFEKPLFVLEMANNHMGDVLHGKKIIKTYGKICKQFPQFSFAFKFQYRDLETFIHPNAKGRDDIKYVKRFSETKLERSNFDELVQEARYNNFITMATPFDETSVFVIEEQNLDLVKIASCSFTDWPLLERIVKTSKPIIASTAGATIIEIDRVVSFLQHREKEFVIMHCVGEYPTPDKNMHIGQIDFLKKRYPSVRIGFSTHESPEHFDIIKIAIAKGACVFEKHVGVPTEKYQLNAYSSNPEQFENWLKAAANAYSLCGVSEERLPVNQPELDSIYSLQRGVFVNRIVQPGEIITNKDVFFAFPPEKNQYRANDWTKYSMFKALEKIQVNEAITPINVSVENSSQKVWEIAQKAKQLLEASKITIPGGADLEISHHYGIENFNEFGLIMITVINREYCKKLLISQPGQQHPEQYHEKKEETFHILYGKVNMKLDGVERLLKPGDVITVNPGVRHAFSTETGSVIEEISSTHYLNDSFYTDESISKNPFRKTFITYWM